MPRESLEQAGFRNLQALLIDPMDGLALHNMIKMFSAAVKQEPSTAPSISQSLDSAGRSLCAAAMQSQALISAVGDADRLRYGVDSIRRIKSFYTEGYEGIEDVGFWKHNILRPARQLDLVLDSYINLLRSRPEAVREYSAPLIVELRDVWRPEHVSKLKMIFEALQEGGAQTQGQANLLISEVTYLKKQLT